MSEQEALLAAISGDPADDLPRLVYADWLDENGEPERAEFIRLQVGLVSGCGCGGEGCAQCMESRERVGELFGFRDARGHTGLPKSEEGGRYHHTPLTTYRYIISDDREMAVVWHEFTWARGFIGLWMTRLQPFLDHAGGVFRLHPVAAVRLMGREPGVHSKEYGWWDSGEFVCDEPDSLPGDLWEHLPDGEVRDGREGSSACWRMYPSRLQALLALSEACSQYGSRAASAHRLGDG